MVFDLPPGAAVTLTVASPNCAVLGIFTSMAKEPKASQLARPSKICSLFESFTCTRTSRPAMERRPSGSATRTIPDTLASSPGR